MPYLSVHDVQQLLKDHGNALVAKQSGHGTVVHSPHKLLVELDDAGVGVSERL